MRRKGKRQGGAIGKERRKDGTMVEQGVKPEEEEEGLGVGS